MQPLPNYEQPYAVVIGLDDGLTGIQTARILAARNVPVVAIAGDPNHPCCKTRVCERIVFARTKDETLIAALEELGPHFKQKAVLFPCQDVNVGLVSAHRERLDKWYHIILPPHEMVEMLADKVRFYAYAQQAGFPVPATYILENRAAAERAAQVIDYPCILKPSHRSPAWTRNTTDKAFKVQGPDELLTIYDRYKPWADALIAQQWVQGNDRDHYSCNCYFDANSQPVVTFVTRKIRQWPPVTGQGCSGEECRDDVVLNETVRLYKHVNYRGLGYVEMKRDARTGQYFIIEPNIGRPTGRSATAEASGVELMYTMYCDAIGWPLPANRQQQYNGTKWIHLRQDIQSALHYWRRGDLTIREWWQSWRGHKAYALFSRHDPAPFMGDLQRVARLYLSSKHGVKE